MINFDLNIVRNRLESLEETIIFRLLERAQFKQNLPVYAAGAFSLPNQSGDCLLDYMHKFTEEIYGKLGRFNIAEEKAFFALEISQPDNKKLSDKINSQPENHTVQPEIELSKAFADINLTAKIRKNYCDFVKTAFENGDDGEYGSAAEADIAALLALSKRIHYGSFYVAECKFQENIKGFTEAVIADNSKKVLEMLTNRQAEERVLARVREKCQKIQSAYTSQYRKVIEPQIIDDFYRNTIIPLTVEGELQYFFRRIKNEN